MNQKKKISRKVISYVLALVMVFSTMIGIVPGMSLTAYAAGVSYVDGSGESKTVDATELAASTTSWANGSWYIVPAGGLTISGRITVNGTVNLILRDGATLTASAGITTTGATLNIYAQSAGTGTLTAKGSNGARNSYGGSAGIGGCGGAYEENGGAGGTVSIFGGTVTATGGNSGGGGGGAGIGGGGAGLGRGQTGGTGGTVSIFGGTVTATGGDSEDGGAGAGIGGGGKEFRGSAGANGTLTLGAGVKLYSGTNNSGTVLDGSDSTERSYSGSRPQNMFAEFISAGSVDKTALNDAITAAETLYDSIKNNNDYTDIASTLKTAIDAAKDVAGSDTADQDAVDAATTAITTAKTNAEAAKKDVDDTTEANKVSTLIENLPAKEAVKKDDKTAIDAAKAAFDALTDDQKAKVSDADKQKLNDAVAAIAAIEKDEADTAAAKAVSDKIAALPAKEAVTKDDKEAIEAARAAYNALTDDQKKKVDADTLKKLTDAETALAAAEQKEADDTAAAQNVTDIINALPAADDVTTSDKAAIEAARAAYNALTDDQKAKVTPETLKKLTDAEDRLAVLQAMSEVSAKTGSEMTYTGKPIQLINVPTTKLPEGYKMVYAVTTENKAPTDEKLYTTDIPTGTNAGTYYVWYKVVGDENHLDSEPAWVKTAIQKAKQTVTAKDISLKVGKSAKINAKTSGDGALSYKIKSGKAVTVDSKGNVKAVKAGTSVITITAAGTDNYLSGTAQIKVTVTGEEGLNVQMLRLYNPNSGEHFYTASVKEKEDLVKAGWKYEGLAWKAPAKSKTPVYRLYNPNAGDHHFTMSAAEKASLIKAGWKDEGIGWYSDDAKTKPVYRAYNPNAVSGTHHYTLSKDEMKTLIKAGWKDEGIAFYAK